MIRKTEVAIEITTLDNDIVDLFRLPSSSFEPLRSGALSHVQALTVAFSASSLADGRLFQNLFRLAIKSSH